MQARPKNPGSHSNTIAITGATGFVGSTIIKLLVSQGWRVRALARDPNKLEQFADCPIEWVYGDLSNSDCLDSLVYNSHAVIHCAGTVRGSQLSDFIAANVEGVSNLVTAILADSSQPRLLLISSLAARMPDISDYAKSKRQGEAFLATHISQLKWTILRPAAIYGVGDQEMKPLLDLMQKGVCLQLSGAISRFSLIHVDDFAQAVAQWLDNGVAEHEIIEIDDGFPNGYGWQDISHIASGVFRRPVKRIYIPVVILKVLAAVNNFLAKMINHNPMLTPGKARELAWHDWVCRSQPKMKIAHWQPRYQFEQGLKRLYNTQ
ncbi:MAG: NAD-dependent epimerase/dehydratase family protein [Methylococcales bacterium]